MTQCVVIADDLTGANATGVVLKKMDYKAYTAMNMERIELKIKEEYDCVLYPTDSRGASGQVAYNRVKNVCSLLKSDEVKVYGKRIDSTLRGNLGSETDAMLDCLGEDYIAVVVPCFPDAGRVVIGGYMLVNGLPLHKTNIALDPKTPVNRSDVKPLFEKQSKYKIESVLMSDMMEGAGHIAKKIKQLSDEGARIIIFDCVTQEDIDLIADAVLLSGKKVISVDPGVFTAALARKCISPGKKRTAKLLAVVGSVNSNTKEQLEALWLSQSVHSVIINTRELLAGDDRREAEIARAVSSVADAVADYSVFTVTTDGIYSENRIKFEDYTERLHTDVDGITAIINAAFAEIAFRILKKEPSFKGMYASGGDITFAICRKLRAAGIDLLDEVIPLAAYGQFIKGEFDGIRIVTKGGSQGGKDAINRCITYLKEKLYI